ncbi:MULTISPECIES: carboxymuconolactone decarboxylase [unclassified Spirosoma]|uniref:carboxymuconolactone decarboxylase family protein n=1 Tax=unclassified Spirosoma TaxID=2621999 RepID=UPI0009661F40|nr:MULTISPECIES: carboxymuconolactone decarboxylase [unclassified Spirosoma]MBN8821719.1 carboxymuconolactone decarboxylase [Spirosoma sp.]OJW80785.1 MAG: carboxymuconolactone decarboxylase [Spirosoma sp. 48-14]
MPHIPLPEQLPGITGLLEYRLDTAMPIRELTQILLRGESTLTTGERELIAALVSSRNCTAFCEAAHTKAADILLGDDETARAVKQDVETAPVSEKMKALLQIAALTQQNGSAVTSEAVSRAREAGATDREIHDTVLIAALFCLYNKYVDGLATIAPSDPAFYQMLGERITGRGYVRPPGGYPVQTH